jgi:hypothetical protein
MTATTGVVAPLDATMFNVMMKKYGGELMKKYGGELLDAAGEKYDFDAEEAKRDFIYKIESKDKAIELSIKMEHSIPKPIVENFKDMRKNRQDKNDTIAYESLINDSPNTLKKKINPNAYKRMLSKYSDLECDEETLLQKCKDEPLFATAIACNISKNASRQGSNDEIEQLRICNITSEKFGVFIKKLTATELRPTKDGYIISDDDMKMKEIKKDNCLKSFDGMISYISSGELIGYITAKIAYGSGGHQDNVFEEMDTMAEWWKKYKYETEEILIVLIDTDLIEKFTRIKEKYNDVNNVMVFNHIEFQQYMISKYYLDESI